MKLTELEPKFIRFDERIEPRNMIVGDSATWRERGCPTEEVIGPAQYLVTVPTLAEAQAVQFLCPACFAKNSGPVGTHGVVVAFRDRGVLDHQGSVGKDGKPTRWAVSGTSLDDLTVQPSIDCGCWHGFITNGDAA